MSYKVIDVGTRTHYLDRRERPTPLPKGVEARCLEAVGIHGYHRNGDRWVEYFYDSAKAEREHLAQMRGFA